MRRQRDRRALRAAVVALTVLGAVPTRSAWPKRPDAERGDTSPADPPSLAAAVAASNTFGFELYSRVKADQQNVVCAPVSASIALAMAWAGARGETRREMARVLALGATGPERTHAGVAALLD